MNGIEPSDDDIRTIALACEHNVWKTVVDRDGASLAELFADDYVEITLDGKRVLKDAVVNESPETDEIAAYKIASERVVRIGDDSILLSYHLWINGTFCGTPIHPRDRWATSIWTRRCGRWQCSLFQQSHFIPPEVSTETSNRHPERSQAALEIAEVSPTSEKATTRIGERSFELTNMDDHADDRSGDFRPDEMRPGSDFIVGRCSGVPVACGAIRPVEPGVIAIPKIVPMTTEHIATVIELWRRTEGLVLTDSDNITELARYLADNPRMSHVAVDAGRIVGAVLCGHDGRRGYLHHLAVAAESRGRGVGRALVNACLRQHNSAAIRQCNLFVVDDNEPGRRFWENDGWSAWPKIRLMSRQHREE